uniref:Uncharacterized protein n=1 Tax=Cyprinodon variegatus TaxID=28743 RepID=A0A3Q2GBY7_CYPVA
MKETCRICGRELCGNQRRWIFHPASKLNLQVLLSHALGRELTRDGKGEFACSKCTFMLDRMYRFDTVIARVEALSIDRLQRLLQEKHRLKQCIGGLYWRTNPEEGAVAFTATSERSRDGMVDISGLTHAKYCALLQEDLVYSLYESWAEDGLDCAGSHHCRSSTPRRCRGCSYWRVSDSDYEAVCKVPRKLARSTSCGPSTRYSASIAGGSVTGRGGEMERNDASSSPSIASLEMAEENTQPEVMGDRLLVSSGEAMEDHFSDSLSEEHMGATFCSLGPSLSLTLCMLQSYTAYRPVQRTKGSKLPVLIRQSLRNEDSRPRFPDNLLGMAYGERDNHMPTPDLETPLIRVNLEDNHNLSFADMEDLLEDLYKEYPPPPPHQLQKAQLQVQSLQAKIQESEANNMKLQEKLNEMECELRSLRQATQSQERTIQGLTESISTKDSEAQELYHLIEGQNNTLCKLQELAHRNQLTQNQSLTLAQLQGELVRVQSSLFSLGLELDASQRSLRQSQRQGDDLLRFKNRLNSDLQEALQHREVTEKHNQVGVVIHDRLT